MSELAIQTNIENRIFTICGVKVMVDLDLYKVKAKKSIKRVN